MDLDCLESTLEQNKLKLILANPNFQNPTGVTMSLKRRESLIEMADHFGVPIIEDDPYGQLRYEGDHLPSLVVMDARARDGRPFSGNVIYLSTFSKTLAPGLRLAWVVAPAEVIRKLVQAKQGTDLHTGTFVQMVAYELARGGFLDKHVQHIRAVYGSRRDAILAALQKYMPPGVSWTKPQGGLFIWVKLPNDLSANELYPLAGEERVTFTPGSYFYPGARHQPYMRLNFVMHPADVIEEGIRRLGRVAHQVVALSLAEPGQETRSAAQGH